MSSWVLIAIFLSIIAVIVGVIIFFTFRKNQKEGATRETDYRAFFIIGISFLPLGIIFTSIISPAFISFIAIGGCYIAIGLANRDKWKNEGGIK